jgi:putative endonuclease
MNSNWTKASEGEELAAQYLANAGFSIVERNYHYGHGEIDIIARENDYLVFVEVKTRTNASFGAPEYSITRGKQKQLLHVAKGYLFEQQIDNVPCRFDVIIVELYNKTEIRHIPNAFSDFY